MKILDIIHDTIVDGEGLRTAIYFAGCTHKCKGCHNPESWDFNGGKEMTLEEIVFEVVSNPLIDGVTFTGGCPLCNAKTVLPLAKTLKLMGYNIWCYCGETLDELNEEQLELFKYVDVLVDGKFDESQKDLTLEFRGSRNQRIIKKNILNKGDIQHEKIL